MKAKEPVELIITEMKNIGQQEQHWSDDSCSSARKGQKYIRITAVDYGDKAKPLAYKLKLELPANLAHRFKVGGTLKVTT